MAHFNFKSLLVFTCLLYSLVHAASHAKPKKSSDYPPVQGWDASKDNYPAVKQEGTKFSYPTSESDASQKVEVADPFNWLEEDPTKSKRVQTFIDEQKALGNSFLSQCSYFDELQQTFQQTNDYMSYAQFSEWGPPEDSVFIFAALGPTANLNQWYMATQQELDQAKANNFAAIPGKLLIDETSLSSDGSQYIANWQVSSDKRVAMYTVGGGEDELEIRFMDLTSFQPLPEVIPYSGSMSFIFTPDNQGVIYDRQDPIKDTDQNPDRNCRILYHKIGTDINTDVILVAADKQHPTNLWYTEFSHDNQYLLLYGLLSNEQKFRVYMAKLDQPFAPGMKFFSLAPSYDYSLQYFANDGNTFYFITDKGGADNHAIVSTKINPKKVKLGTELSKLKDEIPTKTVIPANKRWNIEGWIVFASNKAVLIYLEEAKYTFYLYDLSSGKKLQQIFKDFVGKYYQSDFAANRNQGYVETSSFTEATATRRFRLTPDNKVVVEPVLIGNPPTVDFSIFVSEQHLATSKDKTKIPFVMTYRKDHKPDGTQPAWLFFYGAFGKDTFSKYDPYILPWVRDRNGISCYLQIRGGAEEGDSWWQDGRFGNRQHSFDDVIAVARYLVDNKLAASGKIIAEGGQAGAQAAMVVGNQAPEGLFGALLPYEGLFDMLRFPVMGRDTDDYVAEFGDPNTAQGFNWIHPWSPLHHVNDKKTYPAILFAPNQVFEGNDPAHTYKMLAQLQGELPKNVNPILMWLPDNIGDLTSYDTARYAAEECFVNQVLGL